MGAQGSVQQENAAPDERLKGSTEIQGNILAGFNKPLQLFLFLNFKHNQEAPAHGSGASPETSASPRRRTWPPTIGSIAN